MKLTNLTIAAALLFDLPLSSQKFENFFDCFINIWLKGQHSRNESNNKACNHDNVETNIIQDHGWRIRPFFIKIDEKPSNNQTQSKSNKTCKGLKFESKVLFLDSCIDIIADFIEICEVNEVDRKENGTKTNQPIGSTRTYKLVVSIGKIQ